jgi:hypothetical protein
MYPLPAAGVNNRLRTKFALNVFSKFMLERRCGFA